MNTTVMQSIMRMKLIRRTLLVDGEGNLYWVEWRRDPVSKLAVKISFEGPLTVPPDAPM